MVPTIFLPFLNRGVKVAKPSGYILEVLTRMSLGTQRRTGGQSGCHIMSDADQCHLRPQTLDDKDRGLPQTAVGKAPRHFQIQIPPFT
jgi:hypothetical protein